jgi:hypothetical protein
MLGASGQTWRCWRKLGVGLTAIQLGLRVIGCCVADVKVVPSLKRSRLKPRDAPVGGAKSSSQMLCVLGIRMPWALINK